MATTYVGTIGEFESTKEKFTSYIERVNLFLDVNSIPEEKKASTLLTLIGKLPNFKKLIISCLAQRQNLRGVGNPFKGTFRAQGLDHRREV